MATVADFRAALAAKSVDDIITDFLNVPEAAHLSADDICYIEQSVAASFGVNQEDVDALIVGSAKLGFSIIEKRLNKSTILKRYRPFSARSDIDVVIISPLVFRAIWFDLSNHYSLSPSFPPSAGALGQYLVCGWLRPDHFPASARLQNCDLWWESFQRLSRNSRFSKRRVRGGLFYSRDHFRHYASRAIRECKLAEGVP